MLMQLNSAAMQCQVKLSLLIHSVITEWLSQRKNNLLSYKILSFILFIIFFFFFTRYTQDDSVKEGKFIFVVVMLL